MKCSKNLERAIVLGLILSTGVCGSAWAKDFTWSDKGTDMTGSYAVMDKDANYDTVDVSLSKSGGMGEGTTSALIVMNSKKVNVINKNGYFTVKNNITSNIKRQEIEKLWQYDSWEDMIAPAMAIFQKVKSYENNALFARGGSTLNVNTDYVRIEAIGGLTGVNTAISAKNAQWGDRGNNTISIEGDRVEIIGDIDLSKGKYGEDSTNTNKITVKLDGSDSYWYGSEHRDANWENGKLDLTLSNGAEWVYDNNVLLGKNEDKIKKIVLGLMFKNEVIPEDIEKFVLNKLNIEKVSDNEGSEISAITLEGGVVNLKDEEIKKKYGVYIENDLVDYYLGNEHRKVTIGELKGNGGIFKVDLDWDSNKGKKYTAEQYDKVIEDLKAEERFSDYIYIENVDNTTKTNPTQIVDFDASKAHLENMEINKDKLYFANVAGGGTSFETVTGAKAVYSGAGNVYNYEYGVGNETNADNSTEFYVEVTGKSAEGNANYESAKGAMYAGYALGTELDTLNKRMGEARYLEDDNGVWVRYRHSKTGWDDTYETNGDMFQLGFDNEVTEKDGKHYRGVAIDYTDADTNIMGISGDGEHERYAVSLYDTWLGEKGHYRDLVLRGGRINSDYDISGVFSSGYEDIGGDYHQWFGSISAEWGRKNDMGTGWYFEPQVQAQLARVGGASYVSDSGVDVDQDGATSLIGRAGFRIGREYVKDNGKHDNFYIKADLLHEFAGDKSFSLTGNDGRYDKEYDGQETWCDVGIGADISLGKNSYFWADVERTFGADFDNTWQINGGFRWEF